MADKNDDALAQTAVALGEDAKAARKPKKGGKAAATGDDLDSSIVAPHDPADLTAAVESLGEAVEAQGQGTEGYDLSEQAHLDGLANAEAAAAAVVLDPRSLVWDVRDAMLEQFKRRPRPFGGLSQAEQRDVAASFEHAAQELVRKVVEAVAANGQVPVRVLLTKVTLGDDIVISGKVKTFSEDEEDVAVGLLHSARGKHVMLTVASKDDYQHGQREPETDADQRDMEFEAGAAHPADDSDLAGEDERQFVNLKTGMVESPDGNGGIQEREAKPDELAAERERQADFESGGDQDGDDDEA